MANVLVVPVSTKADGWAVTQAVAGALPDSAVFRAFDEAGEAEKLVCAGKSDDWLDSLVTCVAALKAANVVIKGAKPDPERVLLSTKNLDVALSFDASVVFAMQTDTDDVEHVTNRLNLAKQAYIHSPGTAVGFVLDGGDAGAGAAIAEKTGLVYFGSSQKIINTDLLLKKPGGRMSPAQFRVNMMDAARKGNKRIVLPEGAEPRTVQAAAICHEKGIARCVLLAPRAEVEAVAKERHITLPDSLEIIDPADLIEKYVGPMCELRKSKGLTPDQAREQLQDTVVLGTMMMAQNDVDGLVSGAVHTTANTIRPALQLIKTAPGASLVSSVFFMLLPNQVLVYGDCAVNPEPSAEQLADIALSSAATARQFGVEPRVAMLSYSTGSSGSGADVEKVRAATALVRERDPKLLIEGPIQYDAAIDPEVAATKLKDSPVAGQATVFIFPDLNTGNNTYKAVQRSAGAIAVGPVLQGLRKPVNDLSRGALVQDIVNTVAITAVQAQAQAEGNK